MKQKDDNFHKDDYGNSTSGASGIKINSQTLKTDIRQVLRRRLKKKEINDITGSSYKKDKIA